MSFSQSLGLRKSNRSETHEEIDWVICIVLASEPWHSISAYYLLIGKESEIRNSYPNESINIVINKDGTNNS